MLRLLLLLLRDVIVLVFIVFIAKFTISAARFRKIVSTAACMRIYGCMRVIYEPRLGDILKHRLTFALPFSKIHLFDDKNNKARLVAI